MRHGPTQANAKHLIRSHLNIPLSSEGQKIAGELAEHAAKYQLADLKSSDMSRAQETAQKVQETTGAPLSVHAELRPWNLGLLAGQPEDKAMPVIEQLLKHPDRKAPGGGESFNEFASRVLDFVLPDLQDDKTHGIVAHGSDAQTIEAAITNGFDGDLAKAVNKNSSSIEPGGAAVATHAKFQPVFREAKSSHGIAS